MKAKQSVLFVIASLGATTTFAQMKMGLAGNTHAAVAKSVHVNAVAASHAASKAAVATKSTAHATAAVTKNEVKNSADVQVQARANSQASVHASDEAKAHANENSAIFGSKGDNTVNADVDVHEKPVTDKTEDDDAGVKAKEVKEHTKTKVKKTGNGTIKKVKRTKVHDDAESDTEIKSDNKANGTTHH